MSADKHKVVVVVEDEVAQREEVVLSLQLSGMAAYGAPDGMTLDKLMLAHSVDVVVLDLGLPSESGLQIAARLSRLPNPVGVIMLTGRRAMVDKISGLSGGADAYLTKPADPQELSATILALRRRMAAAALNRPTERLEVAFAPVWQLTFEARQLSAGTAGRVANLTELQRQLLMCFKDLPVGKPVSRNDLMDALGYMDEDSDPHRVETLVNRLRQKVRDKLGEDLPLQAVPGRGYALVGKVKFT